MIYGAHFETPLGVLTLLEENHALIAVSFGRQPVAAFGANAVVNANRKTAERILQGATKCL